MSPLYLLLYHRTCANQTNSGAVSTLVDKMGMDAVEIHVGTADIGFGWSAFGLAVLATIGVTAIVITDWGVAAAQAKILAKGEEAMGKATGGRYQVNDFRSDVENHPAMPAATQPTLGTTSLRNKAMETGFGLGKKAFGKVAARQMRR